MSYCKSRTVIASLVFIVAGCGGDVATSSGDTPPPGSLQAPGTQPSGTEPPGTEPPGTEPTGTQQPSLVVGPSGRTLDGPIDGGPTAQPEASFTVGGTVSGLVGERDASSSRLVLEDHHGLFFEVFDNGTFEFLTLGDNPSGSEYLVKVFNQPRLPSQVCTVTNGTGTLTDHDVTDIAVQCAPP